MNGMGIQSIVRDVHNLEQVCPPSPIRKLAGPGWKRLWRRVRLTRTGLHEQWRVEIENGLNTWNGKIWNGKKLNPNSNRRMENHKIKVEKGQPGQAARPCQAARL